MPLPPEGRAPTQTELLTDAFYAWETRGRGWQVWPHAVVLEPAFRPFFHHLPRSGQIPDDARKPTLPERWFSRLMGQKSLPSVEEPEIIEPDAEPDESTEPLVQMTISLAAGTKVVPEAAEHLLLSLAACQGPVSFEVIGTSAAVRVQVACRESDAAHAHEQVRAYFPDAVLVRREDSTDIWETDGPVVVVDFGLSQEFMRPLRTFSRFDVDPLTGIVGALSSLGRGEVGVLQILFQSVKQPWAENILRSVTDPNGDAFFADATDMVTLAREKAAKPLFAVVIRAAGRSSDDARAWRIVQALGGTLNQLASPLSNELVPLTNDDYPDEEHLKDLGACRTRRSGMLLNVEELLSLVHLPSASVRSPKLARESKHTREAPAQTTGHSLILGMNEHAGKKQEVSLSPDQRIRHTYVIGASGTGKSTLLLNMIAQDIGQGHGVGVLDPHGDLIEQVLGRVPEKRFNDVVLLDASDEEYPVGFNILSAHSEVEKNLLASDLVAVFRRLSTTWGDQMTSVLGNAIMAFLESTKGGTLADLRTFLVEPDFREEFLKSVKDPEVVYYWRKEFALLAGRPQAPLLTRLDTFLRPRLVRHMVGQCQDRLDFRSMMDGRKIFLAKLAQGAIGEENAWLLGSLLVTKFHQVALGRQNAPETGRMPFFLYIDEFHNFITPSIASILSGARKFGLGLVLSHQELRQVSNQSGDVASAVIANPYTRICFRIGDDDAKRLESGYASFDAKDLQSLGIGEAIVRIGQADQDFTLTTIPIADIEQSIARERRQKIVELSRSRYARSRTEVQTELESGRHIPQRPLAPTSKPPRRFGKPAQADQSRKDDSRS